MDCDVTVQIAGVDVPVGHLYQYEKLLWVGRNEACWARTLDGAAGWRHQPPAEPRCRSHPRYPADIVGE